MPEVQEPAQKTCGCLPIMQMEHALPGLSGVLAAGIAVCN